MPDRPFPPRHADAGRRRTTRHAPRTRLQKSPAELPFQTFSISCIYDSTSGRDMQGTAFPGYIHLISTNYQHSQNKTAIFLWAGEYLPRHCHPLQILLEHKCSGRKICKVAIFPLGKSAASAPYTPPRSISQAVLIDIMFSSFFSPKSCFSPIANAPRFCYNRFMLSTELCCLSTICDVNVDKIQFSYEEIRRRKHELHP